jgi:hypothetical protein
VVDPAPVASITEHLRGAYGFIMKSAANGSHFRVLPLRDPDQHRFWCVVVVRILPGGDPDRSHPAWIGRRGLRREELSEIMAAIRDDLEPWLADPAQNALRDWVATPDTSVVTHDAVKPQPPGRSVSSDGRPGTGQSGIAIGVPHLNYPSDTAVAGAVSVA